jgi:hypothetical protein
MWAKAAKKPSGAARRRIQDVLGIAPESWDDAPSKPRAPRREPSRPSPALPELQAVVDRVDVATDDLIQVIQRLDVYGAWIDDIKGRVARLERFRHDVCVQGTKWRDALVHFEAEIDAARELETELAAEEAHPTEEST